MSIVIWPRQEVLQLVIPQLGSVGRNLNANTANNLIRRLTKLQTPEGKISFDRWLIVAKEVLRWNDHCIHLFWDMVSLSTYYISRDSSLTVNRQDVSLDLEYVAIFLVLHLHDSSTTSPGGHAHTPQGKSAVSPTVSYEDVWPSGSPLSPTEGEDTVSPQGSPNKDSARAHRKMSPMAGSGVTPMSPRSPKANQSPANKRLAQSAAATGAKTPRSNAQYLHSVRTKIPLILRSLSIDQQDESTLTDLTLSVDNSGNIRNGGGDGSGGTMYSSLNHSVDFAISKKTVDALGLIMCGGYSRDQAVPNLSSLFPAFHTHSESSDHTTSSGGSAMHTSPTGRGDTSDAGEASLTIPFSELSSWINVHMSMNDMLYPVSVSPSYGSIPCSPTTRDLPHISAMSATEADASKDGSGVGSGSGSSSSSGGSAGKAQQQPMRTVNPISSLSRSKPTIINGCSTTVVHVIGGSLQSAKNSFRKMRSMSYDKTEAGQSAHEIRVPAGVLRGEHQLSDSDSEKASPVMGHHGGRSRNLSTQSDASLEGEQGSGGSGGGGGSGAGSGFGGGFGSGFGSNLSMTMPSMLSMAAEDNSAASTFGRTAEDIEFLMRNNTNYLTHPEQMLPPLYLNLCTKAKLYLISPYHSASITGCADCEIVIGAVFGAVILSGCERVQITCACRKLIIHNCVDCAFNVATLTTTIIAGDCRSNTIGPYNTSYKNLRNHLKLAALDPLLSTEEPSANPVTPAALSAAAASVEGDHPNPLLHKTPFTATGAGGAGGTSSAVGKSPNCWASLCDVSACLEAPVSSSNPAGYAVDALDDACPLLPPLPSTARLLPYENFRATTIPFKAESVPFEQCAIRTPAEYLEALKEYRESLAQIRAQVASVMAAPSPTMGPGTAGSSVEEKKRKQVLASAAVSKKFMEWLVASGNAKQVLDLIKLDNEKGTGGSGHQHLQQQQQLQGSGPQS